jgi:hypothetical protein
VIGVLVPPTGEAAVVDGRADANFAASNDPGRPARCYNEEVLHWLKALAERHDRASVMR